MILYLVTRAHGYTMEAYVRAGAMQFLFYDELFMASHLASATYLFTDLDRLTASEVRLAASIWRQLAPHAPAVRLLNDPARVPSRLELLRRLADAGINRYRAWPATATLRGVRFPAFVRAAGEHTGSLTPLLRTPAALGRALRWARLQGHRRRDLLVVEFCDTADVAGIFRKYSAFVVGDEVLPRHLFMSRSWLLKKPDLRSEAFAREHAAFLEQNPHAARLRAICRQVGIDYGRVDYSMLGDAPQIWEINTNPTVAKLAERLTAAFARLDVPAGDAAAISITLDPRLLARRAREAAAERAARRRRALVDRLGQARVAAPLRLLARALRGY